MIQSLRNLPALLFLACLLASSLFVANAQAYEMYGRWAGTYYYSDGRPPVNFTLEVITPGTSFYGQIIEPNTFGNSGNRFLYSDVDGQIYKDGSIRFYKYYDGSGGVSHMVQYDGWFTNHGIEGTWSVDNAWGDFVLYPE